MAGLKSSKSAAAAKSTPAKSKNPFFSGEGQKSFFSKSEENAQHSNSFFSGTTIQPKLRVGPANDQYEQEADSMADRVASGIKKTGSITPIYAGSTQRSIYRFSQEDQDKENDDRSTGNQLQRKPIFESEQDNSSDRPIQKKSSSGQSDGSQLATEGNVTPSFNSDISSKLSSRRGTGHPLPEETQTEMEEAFDQDFSPVRIHTDSGAAGLSQDLQARAFTHGSDVYFNQGEYNPKNREGKKLLAHELTHVVQQGKSHSRQNHVRAKSAVGGSNLSLIQRLGPLAGAAVRYGAVKLGSWMYDRYKQRKIEKGRRTAVELRFKSTFEPSSNTAKYIEHAAQGNPKRPVQVKVRYGKLAEGYIQVFYLGSGFYYAPVQGIPATHPDLPIQDRGKRLELAVGIDASNKLYGKMGIATKISYPPMYLPPGASSIRYHRPTFHKRDLLKSIFGRTYIRESHNFEVLESAANQGIRLETGILQMQLPYAILLDSGHLLSGGFNLIDDQVIFFGAAQPTVRGVAQHSIKLSRSPQAGIHSQLEQLQLNKEWQSKNFKGSLAASFVDGIMQIKGTATYVSKRLNGSVNVTMLVTDEVSAYAAIQSSTPINAKPGRDATKDSQTGKTSRQKAVLTGWATANFIIANALPTKDPLNPNISLNGTVGCVLHPDGYLMGKGTIRVPQAFELLKEWKSGPKNKKGFTGGKWKEMDGEWWYRFYNYQAPDYYIGTAWATTLSVGGGIDLLGKASFGPVDLYDIVANGTFSTGPEPMTFDVSGRINASAEAVGRVIADIHAKAKFAGLLEIFRAGAVLDSKARIQSYLDFKPTIGRKSDENQNAEYFIRGELDLAGIMSFEPKLKLVFDAIGFSPRTYTFYDKIFNIGSMGVHTNMEYIFGSGRYPEFNLHKASFDRGKFRPTVFLSRVLKEKGSEKTEDKDTGGFKQDGKKLETQTSDTKNPQSVPGTQPKIPSKEITTDFRMQGVEHSLSINMGGVGTSKPIIMSTSPQKLSSKITRSQQGLSTELDKYWLTDAKKKQIKLRIGDLEEIKKAMIRVEHAADQLGLDPTNPANTYIPGFKELALQIQIYASKFGLTDIEGAVEPWNPSLKKSRLENTIPPELNKLKPGDRIQIKHKGSWIIGRFQQFGTQYYEPGIEVSNVVERKGQAGIKRFLPFKLYKVTWNPREPNSNGSPFAPIITYTTSAFKFITQNIRTAIQRGKKSRLHRLVDEGEKDRNRRDALGNYLKKNPPAGPGLSLDEYAFASTYEGGPDSQVMPVPEAEQNKQGGFMSTFYQNNQLDDQDEFVVKTD